LKAKEMFNRLSLRKRPFNIQSSIQTAIRQAVPR
jgi:hypothetical protein